VSVVVDTSALFALLDGRDAHHASAVAPAIRVEMVDRPIP